jgi:hypothetical protein
MRFDVAVGRVASNWAGHEHTVRFWHCRSLVTLPGRDSNCRVPLQRCMGEQSRVPEATEKVSFSQGTHPRKSYPVRFEPCTSVRSPGKHEENSSLAVPLELPFPVTRNGRM